METLVGAAGGVRRGKEKSWTSRVLPLRQMVVGKKYNFLVLLSLSLPQQMES